MVKYLLTLLLSTLPMLAQLGPHSDQAFLGQFLNRSTTNPYTNGIVAYWRMDDTGYPITDATGNGHTLSVIDSFNLNQAGKINASIGSTIYSGAYGSPNSSDYILGAGISFTVAGWFQANANPDGGPWLSLWTGGNESWYMGASASSANPALTVVNLAGSAVSITNTFSIPAVGTWTYLAFGYDNAASNIWMQVNGGARNTATCAGARSVGSGNIWFGGGKGASSFLQGPASLYDEVGFWKRTLTTLEVTNLYNDNFGVSYPFTTIYGGALVSSANTSSATNSTITLGANTTISLWVYFTGANNNYNCLFGNDIWYHGSGANAGKLQFIHSGTGNCLISTTNIANDAAWHHYVLVDDGASVKAYKDTVDMGNSVGYKTLNNCVIFKLLQGVNANNFKGRIDEVCIWSRALSTGEISTLYNSGAGVKGDVSQAPWSTGLTVGWHMDTNAAVNFTQIPDFSGNGRSLTVSNCVSTIGIIPK
jgi:hypothetical protein